MPFRFLARFLANHPEVIQRLSESYPIKRAAQLTAYVFLRGQDIGQEKLRDILKSEALKSIQNEVKGTNQKVQTFKKTFSDELRDGIKKIKEETKNKR